MSRRYPIVSAAGLFAFAFVFLVSGPRNEPERLRIMEGSVFVPSPLFVLSRPTASSYLCALERDLRKDGVRAIESSGIAMDWVIYQVPPSVGGNLAGIKRIADLMHGRGKPIVFYINATELFSGTGRDQGDLRPDLLNAAALDIDGARIHRHPDGSQPSFAQNVMDFQEDAWRNFLRSEVKVAIDLGADGICFDCASLITPQIGNPDGGVFNNPDMRGFREFLRGVYSPADLLAKFGIGDIASFDYGRYLHDRGLVQMWKTAAYLAPLYWEFRVYEAQAGVRFFQTLIDEARTYARTTYGRDLVFLGNTSPGYGINFWLEKAFDLEWVEFPYKDLGYPPRCKSIAATKLRIDSRWKKGVFIVMATAVPDLIARGHPANLARLLTAEAFAAGSEFSVPYQVPGYPSGFYSPDLATVAPAYQFVSEHSDYFGSAWTTDARVALFYPLTSYVGLEAKYAGTALALFDAGLQFDVVFSGDDRIVDNTVTAAQLGIYPVVLLADTQSMTARQVQLILDYLSAGGTVIAWGMPGVANEFNDPAGAATRPAAWQNFWNPGIYTYGAGRLINCSASNLGQEYYESRAPAKRNEILGALAGYASPEVASTAPENVNFLVTVDSSRTKMAVHMLNYNYRGDSDSFTQFGSFSLSVRLPQNFSAAGKTAKLLSPDLSGAQTLGFIVSNGNLVVTVPSLSVYNVLVIE